MSENRGGIKSRIEICVQVFLHTRRKIELNSSKQTWWQKKPAQTLFFFGAESQVDEKTPPCCTDHLQRNTKINKIKWDEEGNT